MTKELIFETEELAWGRITTLEIEGTLREIDITVDDPSNSFTANITLTPEKAQELVDKLGAFLKQQREDAAELSKG